MKKEIWLPIEGYKGIYEISDLGRVRSLKYGEKRILRPADNGQGYLMVCLCKDGKRKYFSVHRLVALAFVPNMFGLNEVNHINEDKTDNREENLMWVDSKENINWGTRNQRVSEKNTNGKLSKPVLQFSKNGELIKEWSSIHEVHRVLGFSFENISKCCLGKRKSAYNYLWRYKTA